MSRSSAATSMISMGKWSPTTLESGRGGRTLPWTEEVGDGDDPDGPGCSRHRYRATWRMARRAAPPPAIAGDALDQPAMHDRAGRQRPADLQRASGAVLGCRIPVR